MFELLFSAGIIGQMYITFVQKEPQKVHATWAMLAGVLLLGILGEAWHIPVVVRDGFAAAGMFVLFLLTWGLGLFSMVAAPRITPWYTLGIQTIALVLLFTEYGMSSWTYALLIGNTINLFLCIPALWKYTFPKALLYGWSLVVSFLIGILYLLPFMIEQNPNPVLTILNGMLIFSMGLMGCFAVKYVTILVATIASAKKEYHILFKDWIEQHTTYRTKHAADMIGTLATLILLGSAMTNWIPLSWAVTIGLSLVVLRQEK